MTTSVCNLSEDVGIYIVHYSKLRDRRKALESNLSHLTKQITWVTEQDIEFNSSKLNKDLNAYGVNFRLSSMDRSNNSRSLVKPRKTARLEGLLLLAGSLLLPRGIHYLTDNPLPNEQEYSILELSFMHFECLERARVRNQEWAIILEDDAIVDNQKMDRLILNLDSLKKRIPTWYNISSGAGLTRTQSDPKPDGLGFYRIRPYGTRCASGYLINKTFISKTLELYTKYGIPNWTAIDVVYQIIQRRLRSAVYWQEPSIVTQGSETGLYNSNFIH